VREGGKDLKKGRASDPLRSAREKVISHRSRLRMSSHKRDLHQKRDGGWGQTKKTIFRKKVGASTKTGQKKKRRVSKKPLSHFSSRIGERASKRREGGQIEKWQPALKRRLRPSVSFSSRGKAEQCNRSDERKKTRVTAKKDCHHLSPKSFGERQRKALNSLPSVGRRGLASKREMLEKPFLPEVTTGENEGV